MPATVIGVEYDPNRSANIALVQYEDGEKAYIIVLSVLQNRMTVDSIGAEGADINAG